MSDTQRVLAEIADATRLREGPQGVALLLWNLLQLQTATTHDLAQRLGIPIPVVAAVRRELEKAGLLERHGKGMALSGRGTTLARALWGVEQIADLVCATCDGAGLTLPAAFKELLPAFEALCQQRPVADTALDQAHATPITGLLRAAVLLRHNALLEGPVLFLGDDDLTALACALALAALGAAERFRAVVLDLDARYLELIGKAASDNRWELETLTADYREPLPDAMRKRMATVVTDPPYTLAGLEAVCARAEEAFTSDNSGTFLLSFPQQPPAQWLQCESVLASHGMALRAIYARANRYSGNSMHAHASDLHVLQHVPAARRTAEFGHKGFYTASRGEEE